MLGINGVFCISIYSLHKKCETTTLLIDAFLIKLDDTPRFIARC
jgi:hypothetical protein